ARPNDVRSRDPVEPAAFVSAPRSARPRRDDRPPVVVDRPPLRGRSLFDPLAMVRSRSLPHAAGGIRMESGGDAPHGPCGGGAPPPWLGCPRSGAKPPPSPVEPRIEGGHGAAAPSAAPQPPP